MRGSSRTKRVHGAFTPPTTVLLKGSNDWKGLKDATGQFRITFDFPFKQPPTVVAGIAGVPQDARVSVANVTINGFSVYAYSAANAAVDAPFSFIAEGLS